MTEKAEVLALQFDILSPEVKEDPDVVYDAYDLMRQTADLVWSGEPNPYLYGRDGAPGHWEAVSREACDEILHDYVRFSSDHMSFNPDMGADGLANSFFFMDPPEHQAWRKMLNPYFAPRRIGKAEELARGAANMIIDDFIENGEGDLATVAWCLPGYVLFVEVLGLPFEEVPHMLELIEVAAHAKTLQERLDRQKDVEENLIRLLSYKKKNPGDSPFDLLLATGEVAGRKISFEDVVANAFLIIGAGLETTSNAMSTAFFWMSHHKEERQKLIDRPDMIRHAVEEFLRYQGSVHGLPRTVTEDVELNGCPVKRGDIIMVNYAAANRDEVWLDDAEELRIDRDSNPHLAFGAGVHRCLGSNLARMELRVGIGEVLRRVPDYHIPDDSKCVFVGNYVTRGYNSLPVVFTPAERLNQKVIAY